MATDAEIEAAARAMRSNHFGIFDHGPGSGSYFQECAFRNAEKVVKRARKDARLALEAAEIVRAAARDHSQSAEW